MFLCVFCVVAVFFFSFLKWLFATILFIQKTGVFDDIFNVWFKEHFSCGKETRERSMIELVCQLIEGKISARIRSALLLKWKMPNKMVANQGIHLYWLVFCCCLCFFFVSVLTHLNLDVFMCFFFLLNQGFNVFTFWHFTIFFLQNSMIHRTPMRRAHARSMISVWIRSELDRDFFIYLFLFFFSTCFFSVEFIWKNILFNDVVTNKNWDKWQLFLWKLSLFFLFFFEIFNLWIVVWPRN